MYFQIPCAVATLKKNHAIVLTFSISITHDVLFDSLLAVVIDILFVPHPSRDCEMLVQSMVQFGAGNFNGVSEPVESENLILLLSVICGQRSGPLADGWWWGGGLHCLMKLLESYTKDIIFKMECNLLKLLTFRVTGSF